MDHANLLHPLTLEASQLIRERNIRRDQFIRQTVSKDDLDKYISDDWEIDRELKTKTKIKKLKPHDELLEDHVWLMLHGLGYQKMNVGRQFKIEVNAKSQKIPPKQIDVFAKDDETVVVVECKSSKELKNRSLQKDIGEFANIKKDLANSVRKYFGNGFNPKIIWMFATENILWSENDYERAKQNSIHVIREDELRYFTELGNHLGHAARFQFLAYFLEDQVIHGLSGIKVPAIKGKLGGQTFYAFVTKPEAILKLAFINHHTLDDSESAPTYQRLIKKPRLNSIRSFIEAGGFFPTNIIVSFKKKPNFELNSSGTNASIKFGNLILPNTYKSAWVIDGQHRLYGFSGLEKLAQKENIFVIAFESLSPDKAANMFVDINHEQKSVSKNLIDALRGDLHWESDDPKKRIRALCSRIIGTLNSKVGSPFYSRVVKPDLKPNPTLGGACLNLSAMSETLEKSGLIGSVNKNTHNLNDGIFSSTSDQATLERATRIVNTIFEQVRDANEDAWLLGSEVGLCRNAGFNAIIFLIIDCLEHHQRLNHISPTELKGSEITDITLKYLEPLIAHLRKSTINDVRTLFREGIPLGASEFKELRYKLVGFLRQTHKDFGPTDFEDWKESRSEERKQSVTKKIHKLNEAICSTLFKRLKEHYQDDNYFELAVKSKEAIADAHRKSLDDELDSRGKLEEYLTLAEYKKIITKTEHWSLVSDIFDIPINNEKGRAKNVTWIDKLIPIRNKVMHQTKGRPIELSEIIFVEHIYEEFMNRINSTKDTSIQGLNQ